jgi:hypothetical protein
MSSETLRGEGKELLGPDPKAKRLTDIDLDSSNIVTTTAQRQYNNHDSNDPFD